MAKLMATFFKLLISSSTILCLLLLIYINYYDWLLDDKAYYKRSKGSTKYILYWTGSRSFHLPNNEGYSLFKNCKYKNCFVTDDHNFLPVDEYAAIIFYIPTAANHPKEIIPQKRSPHQRYVFANFETPLRFHHNNVHYVFNHFYNWTMTYRFDSDIVKRHGSVIKRNNAKYRMPTKTEVLEKNGSVAWIVSNCESVDHREELAQNLAKHIKLDVFGKCGTLKCPSGQDCYNHVAKHYKFYLSFENSHCKDYTTEKFFKTLEGNIVPIVYGGGNYPAIAPKHSFINVEDFYSAEILASYLKILEQDVDSYLEYFEWKKDHIVEKSGQAAMCNLCEMLNDDEAPPKVYEDIEYWWFSDEMSGCKTDDQLPVIVFED